MKTDTNPNMKALIRRMIRGYVADLKAIRTAKKFPTLYGEGFTVAIKGTTLAVAVIDRKTGEYHMAGRLNHGATFYTMEKAREFRDAIAEERHMNLEVIHMNELRARTEKMILKMLPNLIRARNHGAFA